MKKLNANLSEIFDVEPIKEVPKEEILPAAVVEYADPVNADADFARDNIRELVVQGNQAVNELMLIARDGQHPRAFEVVATLIKNTAEANEKLMIMQKSVRDMKNIKSKETVNVDKAIFVGSTAELVKLLKTTK